MPKTFFQGLVGLIVVIAWLGALAGDLLTSDPTALQYTTPVMLVYAGYLFGDSIFRKRDNG